MNKLLVVSDLHISGPGEKIIGLDPSKMLQAALEAAVSAHPDAAALILLGDLTHHGLDAEYQELARILAPIKMPIIPMMGNHDRREAFLETFPQAPQTASGHIQQLRDFGNHRIITLDSLDGPPYPDNHHSGRLCPERMAFLEEALATRDRQHALVFVHHPPFDTGIVGMDHIKMADGEALLDRLAAHGDVHLMCGHVHCTISGSLRGVPWTMLKSTCHHGVLNLTDDNPHLSSNAPAGYGVVLLQDDGFVVHTVDVGLPDLRIFGAYDAGA